MGIKETLKTIKDEFILAIKPAGETAREIARLEPSRPIKDVKPGEPGFVSALPPGTVAPAFRRPTFVSGGGAGEEAPPTPPPAISEEIAQPRPEPSIDIQKTREQARIAKLIREEAERRGVDISTRARELGFISALREEAGQPPERKFVTPTGADVFTPTERRKIPSATREDIQPKVVDVSQIVLSTEPKEEEFTLPEIIKDVTMGGTEEQPPKPIPEKAFIGEPISTVEPVFVRPEERGLLADIGRFVSKKREEEFVKTIREGRTFPGELISFGAGITASVIGSGQFAIKLATQPIETGKEIIAAIPKLPEKLPAILKVIEEEPSFALGFGLSEFAQARFIGKGLAKGRELTGRIRTRLSPKFRPVQQLAGGDEFIRIPSVSGDDIDIAFAKPLKQLEESLEQQAKLSGKQVRAISAQTDLLTPILRRERLLRRELFFDPRGRLRISRLGVGAKKEASLLDILTDDVTFRVGRRQALVLERFPVEKLPTDISKTLLRGQALTSRQALRLRQFQKIPTGKLKPIGFLSTEPELILSAGERIARGKVLAKTIIKGKPVEFIELKVKTPTTAQTSKLLRSADLSSDVAKSSLTSIAPVSRPFISPSKISLSSLSRITRLGKISKIPSPKRVSKRISPRAISPRVSIPKISKAPSPISRVRAAQLSKISKLARQKVIAKSPIIPTLIRRKPRKPFRKKKLFFLGGLEEFPIKRKRRRGRGREDLAFVEGFTARTLGLAPRKIKLSDIKLGKREKALGIRGAPIIIPDIPSPKARRRKRK